MQKPNPFSPYWYRIAALRPRLRNHIELHRHQYRGEQWYILQDDTSGRFHRFSPAAYQVIGLMDGRHSMDDIWKFASQELKDDALTQAQIITLMGQLYKADSFTTEVPPDTKELFERQYTMERRMKLQRWKSPLAIRIPLFDPDAFIVKALPYVGWLFSIWGVFIWLGVVFGALLMAFLNWPELTENLVDRVLAGQNILVLIVTFPIVKLLHEFGHAFAARVNGGQVHEMGIMFLMLMPIPYVDATSSTAFASRWKRVLVGASGMLFELFIAATALYFWLDMGSGFVSAVLYNVMIIAGVSTILFNANPLIKFDGYYILSDWIEIPNLATRSTKYLGYLFQRYLFNMSNVKSPAHTQGERVWFVFYGIASFIYRLFLISFIVFLLADQYFIFGVLLAIWAVWMMAIMPVYKQLKFVVMDKKLKGNRPRALMVSGGVLAFLVAIAITPMPLSTIVEGVVWADQDSRVRMTSQGFVKGVLVKDGDTVQVGQVIAVCDNYELLTNRDRLRAQLDEFRAQYQAVSSSGLGNRVQTGLVSEQIVATEAKLSRVISQIEGLQITSKVAGTFVSAQSASAIGHFIQRGDILGFVVKPQAAIVRVLVPLDRINLVRQKTTNVSVRVVDNLSKEISALVSREVPTASQDIPSAALSFEGGGVIAVNPGKTSAGGTGPVAFDSWFQVDLKIDLNEDQVGLGERVYARFRHGNEMLGVQIYRSVRQTFLNKFGI
ncbi:MAG: putative peptide zinc metalloprotease protein [Arenicella sp.]|jgi:putative peptide zinc metalloprotease protein